MWQLSTVIFTASVEPLQPLWATIHKGQVSFKFIRLFDAYCSVKLDLSLGICEACFFFPSWVLMMNVLLAFIFIIFSKISRRLFHSKKARTQPICKPLQASANFLIVTPLAPDVRCLVALIIFRAKQVAILVSLWLHLRGRASRLDRDDRVSSLPGAWP